MKDYSLRIELRVEASTDDEAKKKTELLLKELPRMEGVSFKNHSLLNIGMRKIIDSSEK